MVTETAKDNPKADYFPPEASDCPNSPISFSSEDGQLSRRRDTQTTSGSIIPEDSGSIQALVTSSTAAASIMTSGEFVQTAPLLAHKSKRSMLYKALCFLLLIFQGGVLDFYLIIFTDLNGSWLWAWEGLPSQQWSTSLCFIILWKAEGQYTGWHKDSTI